MNPHSLISDYFYKSFNINPTSKFIIEEVNARSLITADRIDLIAKIKYVECVENRIKLPFIQELYKKHIEAFSHGTYSEPGNDDKNTLDKYISEFHNLIYELKNNGFNKQISLIPVGKDNIIMDGSHRVAISAYFNYKIPIVRFNNLSVSYNTEFFKKRLLEEVYLDYLVDEYIRFKRENIYIACLWPKAQGILSREDLLSMINENCKIVHSKEIHLSYDGIRNLLIQIYGHHEWIGDVESGFEGVDRKAIECFKSGEPTGIFVLECLDFKKILELKSRVRELCGVGNHSIHITDNENESLQLSKAVLNSNSVNFLNSGKPSRFKENYKKNQIFKNYLEQNNLPLELYAIDSSSVMAMYGIREADDLDFLTLNEVGGNLKGQSINCHNNSVSYYETSLENLIYNPQNYFYFNDLKFITLDWILKFKKNRNESKDKIDVGLISGYRNKNFELKRIIYLANKTKRNIKFKVENNIKNLLRKLGLFEIFKGVFHNIKNRKNRKS